MGDTTTLQRREPIEPHDPALYAARSVVTDYVDGFEGIGEAEVTRFFEQGFLAVEHAFRLTEVHDWVEGLLDLINGSNPDFKGPELEALGAENFDALSREEKQDHVRKLMYFVDYDPRLKAMSEHPKLLGLLERLMGEPPVMWSDQALLKPPKIGREKPWHQDLAYFDVDFNKLIIGCWIALDEATLDNGCMVVIPGSHRAGPVIHFQRRDWQICDTEVAVQDAVAVPLKPGGALIFSALLHHGTPLNHSPLRRRAVQLHYYPESAQRITKEERMAAFGSEGKDVDC